MIAYVLNFVIDDDLIYLYRAAKYVTFPWKCSTFKYDVIRQYLPDKRSEILLIFRKRLS